MKYLFYDCEFASCYGGKEKICEFGYVLVDEKFNVLYKGNIIINPNISKKDWDWYALKKVLTRKIEVYESKLTFPSYFKQISYLINNADYILGHSIEGDVHALNCELQRYNLPCLNFKFYDIKEMYKVYNNDKKNVSVQDMLKELEIKGDSNAHDAGADALNTMLELKAILKKVGFTLEEMIEMCPQAKDETTDFKIKSRIKAEHERLTRREKLLNGDYSDGTNDLKLMGRNKNMKIFYQFLDNVQQNETGSEKLKGKKVTISLNYEVGHFKETMNLVQIVKNNGGEYILKASNADIFVTYRSLDENGVQRFCTRESYVDKAIGEGKQIKKMTLEEFLDLLDLTEEKLESLPFPSLECLLRKDAIIKDKNMK